MAGEYYNHGTFPATATRASSSQMRAELDAIEAGFDKLPVLAGNNSEIVTVKADATGLESKTKAELDLATKSGGNTWTGTQDFTGATTNLGSGATATTQTAGDSSTKVATTAFVSGTAFAAALPSQAGNAGKFVTTNGTTASWSALSPPSLTRSARTSNTILAAADLGTFIEVTSGTFTQTLTAAATLGAGWWCYYKNSGTGVITLDPNASETIGGSTTFDLRQGATVLIQCDGSNFNMVNVGLAQMRRPIFATGAQNYRAVSVLDDLSAQSGNTQLASSTNICYVNNLFIASNFAGASGNVASSPDGITWTLRAMPSSQVWKVASNAAGTQGLAVVPSSNVTAKSTDGTTWSSATVLPAATNAGAKLACAGTTWLVTGFTTGTDCYVSTDHGATWSAVQTMPIAAPTNLYSINGKLFIWTGTTAYYSSTGLTGSWTLFTLPIAPNYIVRGADGYLYFGSTSNGAAYRMTTESTYDTLPTLAAANGICYPVNGVLTASSSSGFYDYHATGWTQRTMAYTYTSTQGTSYTNGSVTVIPSGSSAGNSITLSHSTATAIFEV